MNERMLELYRQAFVPHTTTCPDNNMPYETVLFSTEKFAELIVRECMLICGAIQGAGELRNMHEFASGAAQCRAIIKRDFGVEE